MEIEPGRAGHDNLTIESEVAPRRSAMPATSSGK
jgi:hypothetical protein